MHELRIFIARSVPDLIDKILPYLPAAVHGKSLTLVNYKDAVSLRNDRVILDALHIPLILCLFEKPVRQPHLDILSLRHLDVGRYLLTVYPYVFMLQGAVQIRLLKGRKIDAACFYHMLPV